MGGDRTIFDEPHYQSLELLAAQALAQGNVLEAFKLADRRCRILPLPEPHCYVLRGEASYQLGARAAAIADIAIALEIAPADIAANRRMLTWAHGPQQEAAALTLIGLEWKFASLRHAVQILYQAGQRDFVRVTILDDAVEGWAVWQDRTPLEISITRGADSISELFEPDAFHPLAEFGHATSFWVRRPKSTKPQSVLLSVAGREIRSLRAPGNDAEVELRVRRPQTVVSRIPSVTVIVPIYGDYEATRICLETLLEELQASQHCAILVDDATPDDRIAEYLAKFATHDRVRVLTNAQNLGFVGSINRALDDVGQGDVIFLNSDTVVVPGFINRLAAAARSSTDIGTVTPLSNNGEFTSFPIPNMSNPLPQHDDIKRIDKIAAKANGGRIVDIPSGIGFCLYVTRACLDAVGLLSEDFGQGYLEDVDFCLRARAHRYRNVCAPSVYVGHAGSKSFGQKKRSLVVRNLSVLERRFPQHRSECGAFMAADPLRSAREAIERAAVVAAGRPSLLATGAGAIGAVARARARELLSESKPVMILEVRNGTNGAIVKITDPAGGLPQSFQFELSSSTGYKSLSDSIRHIKPSRVEILDPTNIPLSLVDLLLKLNIPHDVFIADAGLLASPSKQPHVSAIRSAAAGEIAKQHDAFRQPGAKSERRDWAHPDRAHRWLKIAQDAQRILAPSAEAESFAARVLPKRTIEPTNHSPATLNYAKRANRKTAPHLGFVPARSCAQEQWLMRDIACTLGRLRPGISITVLGTTLDDIGLMRSSNVFVTGTIKVDEFEQVTSTLGVRHLFLSATQPLFGHPLLSAAFSSKIPTAYFDWSARRVKANRSDLPIDPCSSFDDLVGALSQWMRVP